MAQRSGLSNQYKSPAAKEEDVFVLKDRDNALVYHSYGRTFLLGVHEIEDAEEAADLRSQGNKVAVGF